MCLVDGPDRALTLATCSGLRVARATCPQLSTGAVPRGRRATRQAHSGRQYGGWREHWPPRVLQPRTRPSPQPCPAGLLRPSSGAQAPFPGGESVMSLMGDGVHFGGAGVHPPAPPTEGPAQGTAVGQTSARHAPASYVSPGWHGVSMASGPPSQRPSCLGKAVPSALLPVSPGTRHRAAPPWAAGAHGRVDGQARLRPLGVRPVPGVGVAGAEPLVPGGSARKAGALWGERPQPRLPEGHAGTWGRLRLPPAGRDGRAPAAAGAAVLTVSPSRAGSWRVGGYETPA